MAIWVHLVDLGDKYSAYIYYSLLAIVPQVYKVDPNGCVILKELNDAQMAA